jgi:hypothetical protein
MAWPALAPAAGSSIETGRAYRELPENATLCCRSAPCLAATAGSAARCARTSLAIPIALDDVVECQSFSSGNRTLVTGNSSTPSAG